MDEWKGIRELMSSLGVTVFGAARPDMWERDDTVSKRVLECSRPSSVMECCRSVLVFGIPIQQTVLETAPSIYYNKHYDTVNTMLDIYAQRVVMHLDDLGYDSVFVPRDGYHGINGLRTDPSAFFSHRHAAYLAGLGTFGLNNVILNEKYGPRIRFTSVLTSADFPYGRPMGKEICIKCRKCTKECPVGAVSGVSYPSGITLKSKCVEYSAKLASKGCSPCGRCIAVCPIGMRGHVSPSDKAIANIRSFVRSTINI